MLDIVLLMSIPRVSILRGVNLCCSFILLLPIFASFSNADEFAPNFLPADRGTLASFWDQEIVRQESNTTWAPYIQCSDEEKSAISGMVSKCYDCLTKNCPAGCCRELSGENQIIICEVPAQGSAGCCIRVMGAGQVEIATKETASVTGAGEDGACVPNNSDKPIASSCGTSACAVAGVNGTQVDCPSGIQVPLPRTTFQSPAKCVDPSEGHSGSDGASGATGSGKKPSQASEGPSPAAESSAQDDNGDDDDDDDSDSTRACFHGTGVVELIDGSWKSLADLSVGDSVKVGVDEFSEVFMFTHRNPESHATFLNILTASGHQLKVTAGHYVYVNGDLAPADRIRKGDRMTLASGVSSAVLSVTQSLEHGIYNPQTLQGDIVVNGVKASTYTVSFLPHHAHTMLAPLRYLFDCFGVSFSFMENGTPSSLMRYVSAFESALEQLMPL